MSRVPGWPAAAFNLETGGGDDAKGCRDGRNARCVTVDDVGKNALDAEPIVRPAWDPMGILAR